jgi:hypothetical protein
MTCRSLVFNPQPNATPDEIMQVLKVFTLHTAPPELRTTENLFKIFDSIPTAAQRHFTVKEHNV